MVGTGQVLSLSTSRNDRLDAGLRKSRQEKHYLVYAILLIHQHGRLVKELVVVGSFSVAAASTKIESGLCTVTWASAKTFFALPKLSRYSN